MNRDESNNKVYDMKKAVSPNKLVGLWRLTDQFRMVYLVAILAVGLAALAQTGIYYLLGYLVDDILPEPDAILYLPWLALAFVGLAAGQGGFTYLSGRWAAYTAEHIARRMRDYLYDHLQRLPFTYHDQTQTGELIQRVTSDIDAVRLFYSEQAIGIGRIIFLFTVNLLGIYFLIDPYLAMMSVVVIPFVLVASVFFFIQVGKAFELFQEQESLLSNRFQENISGVRVVKAFARQEHETERFEDENSKKRWVGIKFTSLHGLFWPITDIFCGGQMLLGYWLGANMAINGDITIGQYIAYAQMVTLIIWPIRNMGRLITQASTAAVSYTRLRDIIERKREKLSEGVFRPQTDLAGAIRFNDVSFGYDTSLKNEAVKTANTVGYMAQEDENGRRNSHKVPVLHNISFEVAEGQTVAILGATGSGKTSMINLLPRFYDFDSGYITVDGVDLREYPPEYLRQQIGLVMQEPFLFSGTIRENITYGVYREVTDEDVFAAAKAAAVHDVILSFPDGYNTLVGERGVTLSGGQKQRVTLARTLLKNPRILVLDDATSAVDTETESQIRDALKQILGQRTTFIIAHRVQSVMLADLILVLDEGRIVQRGTHQELVNQPGIYQRVYDLQARIEDELAAELTANGGLE